MATKDSVPVRTIVGVGSVSSCNIIGALTGFPSIVNDGFGCSVTFPFCRTNCAGTGGLAGSEMSLFPSLSQ